MDLLEKIDLMLIDEGFFSRKKKDTKEKITSQTAGLIDQWIDGGMFKDDTSQIMASRLGKAAKEAIDKGVNISDWATNWEKENPNHTTTMKKLAKKFTGDILATQKR